MGIRRDASDCAKTRRRKDRWMQVRAGRLEGSWPGFGLDVGMIGGIAFSQNSSRGRRQEEALASCRQTTADQPCQARPSPPDQTRWIRPSPAANLPPAPRNTEPSAGERPTGTGWTQWPTAKGARAIQVRPDSPAAQGRAWPAGLPGPRFLLFPAGIEMPAAPGELARGRPHLRPQVPTYYQRQQQEADHDCHGAVLSPTAQPGRPVRPFRFVPPRFTPRLTSG